MTNIVVKLATFFDDEIGNSNISDLIVTKYQTGEYSLYGKYLINTSTAGWHKVTVIAYKTEYKFTSLKNAVAWCTLSRAGLGNSAKRLHMLDLKLSSLQVEMSIHSKLYRSAINKNSKDIFATKIQDDIYKKQQVNAEIKAFINESINIQNKLFKDDGREFAPRR